MEGRRYHGCGHYQNDLGERTLLVTGGLYEEGGQMSLRASTELLGETSEVWRLAGAQDAPNLATKLRVRGGWKDRLQ